MRSAILRRMLTKPIWFYQTRKAYSIRKKAFSLPAIVTNPDPATYLVVLTTVKSVCDAIWTAQSFLRQLPNNIGVCFVIDGKIDSRTTINIKRVFPNILLKQTSELVAQLEPLFPNIVTLGRQNPIGRKLAAILSLHRDHNIIYSDSDVLCFGPMPELTETSFAEASPKYIQDVDDLNADPVTLENIKRLFFEFAPTLNSGFQYIPKNSLSIETAELLLQQGMYDASSWFIEQTIFAVLMHIANAQPLPRSQYVVSCQRQFYFETDVDYEKIAVRHFVSPVRHLMYSQGIPRLFRQWTSKPRKSYADR